MALMAVAEKKTDDFSHRSDDVHTDIYIIRMYIRKIYIIIPQNSIDAYL